MSIDEQPTGYHFDVKGKLVKEHECPICLHLIRNSTELPCSHLMCRDCLVYYEETELERDENANFICSLCQEAYHRNQKKEFRSLDRIIRESLDVKCKNWKDGCVWVGNISGYQDHHVNVCEFLIVECSNNGCLEQMQRREIGNHKNVDHHETCPFFPVLCKNSECNDLVLRKQMVDHCKNACQHQLVPCLYAQVGCNIQLPRHSMSMHHQEATEHHSFLLLKGHLDLSKKNEDLEKKLTKSNKKIEQLQETVMKQEESIERQHAEIVCLQGVVNKQEDLIKNDVSKLKFVENDVKKNFTNLETFAQQTANLLEMISEIKFQRQIAATPLYQKNYDESNTVKKFKAQGKEKDDEKTDCYYLQVLGIAVKKYHNVYFPTTFEKRLKRIERKLTKNYTYRYDNFFYLKIDSFTSSRSICFNVYKDSSLFEKEMRKSEKWNRYSGIFAAYYDYTERCYFVALGVKHEIKEVLLLHKTYENQSKKLNVNGKTLLERDFYISNPRFFIFQIERM